jgi:hypothetical protein
VQPEVNYYFIETVDPSVSQQKSLSLSIAVIGGDCWFCEVLALRGIGGQIVFGWHVQPCQISDGVSMKMPKHFRNI